MEVNEIRRRNGELYESCEERKRCEKFGNFSIQKEMHASM
jgi:hypothetical protein